MKKPNRAQQRKDGKIRNFNVVISEKTYIAFCTYAAENQIPKWQLTEDAILEYIKNNK